MFKATSLHLPISVAAVWGDVDLDDLVAMERYYSSIYDLEKRFCSLVDARRARVPASPVRREMAEMSNRLAVRSTRLSIATSTVLDSQILVGALTAVRWFIRSEVTLVYHSSGVESLEFLTARAVAEGLAVPPAARDLVMKLDAAKDGDALARLF